MAELDKKLEELKTRLAEINDINNATALLGWDQTTYMPPGGAPARGQQLSTLSKIAQEKFIEPAVGKLLDDLQPYAESLPYDSDDASLIRVTCLDYEQATKVPPDFLGELNLHSAAAYQAELRRGLADWRTAGEEAGDIRQVPVRLRFGVERSVRSHSTSRTGKWWPERTDASDHDGKGGKR